MSVAIPAVNGESETGDFSQAINNETDENPIDFSQVRSIESIETIESDVVQYEYVTGLRKNSKLLYSTNEKQLYFRKNTNKKYTVFVCNEKKCPAQLQLFANGKCSKSTKHGPHNHCDKHQEFLRLKSREVMVGQATDIAHMASTSHNMRDLSEIYRQNINE